VKTRTIICPYCERRTNVPENVRSKAIRCGSCRKVYFLETPATPGRSDSPTRQDQQALSDTRPDERRPRDDRRTKKAPAIIKKAPSTEPTTSGPSIGEIFRFVFRWTLTAVVVFGMLVGAYFGYFSFIEYRAKQACKDSERYCDQSEFTKAHDAAERGIDADKDFALSYARRGRAKYFMLDYDGALADYKKAIELDSQLGLAYAYRSIANYEEGYLEEAIDDADRATRLLKDSGVAHGYRGLILSLRSSQMSEAISEANKAVALDNKSPHPLIARAYLNDKQGKTNEADGDIRAVATMQGAGAYPSAISAHFHLHRAMPGLNNQQKPPITPQKLELAKKEALDAIKSDANSIWGHYALAEYYVLNLQEKEARDEARTVVRLAPNASRGYELSAIIECVFGNNIAEAIEVLSRGIERLPNSARLYLGRAELHSRMNNQDKAIADASKAIQLNPRNARYFDFRARMYREQRDFTAANADEAKAREIRDYQR
jgi:tetratricopeptide (TPR) repeat protein